MLILKVILFIVCALEIETETTALVDFQFNSKRFIDCKIAIIGSGFAGSFAAYKLSPTYRDSLCIIEKLERDGGKIWDVSEYPGGPVFGMGALRIMATQKAMIALAEQLKIELPKPEEANRLVKARGKYFYQKSSEHWENDLTHMCETAYKNLTCKFSDGNNPYDAMHDKFIETFRRFPNVTEQYPDMITFVKSIITFEGWQFIRAANGYLSFYSSISSRSLLEYLNAYNIDSNQKYFPIGGMSEFIRRMLAEALINGVQIYRNELVIQISSDTMDINAPFYIETSNYMFRAQKVLCSIDPLNFANVSGNIAEAIRSSPEFQVFKPISAAVVTTWWNSRWWEQSELWKDRKLNRVVSIENCFNSMEIPNSPYIRDQNVTRSVYDDGSCVEMWKSIVNLNDKDLLAKEVISSLQNFFYDVKVPVPRNVFGFVHSNGWYFQKPESKYSNDCILDWSFEPVAKKRISLIGTSYNLNMQSWCDGGLKQTAGVLSKFYNFNFTPDFMPMRSPDTCRKNTLQTANEEKLKSFVGTV